MAQLGSARFAAIQGTRMLLGSTGLLSVASPWVGPVHRSFHSYSATPYQELKASKRHAMAATVRNSFARYKSTTPKVLSLDATGTLFPAPTRFPPSALSPHALPGSSPEAEQTLLEVLKHNYENNHIYFNDKGFHK